MCENNHIRAASARYTVFCSGVHLIHVKFVSGGNSISVFVFLTRSLSDILGPALGHAPLFCKSHLHGYLPNWIVYARRADDVCVSGLMLLAKCSTAYIAGADAEHTLCQIVFVFPLHRLHYTSFRATVSGFHPFA